MCLITSLKGPKHSQQPKPGFWFRPDTETETRNGRNLKKMAKEISAPMLTLDHGIDSRYRNPVSVVGYSAMGLSNPIPFKFSNLRLLEKEKRKCE